MRLPSRPPLRWQRSRGRAQDLVEYSLVVAVLALVGIVGLNVLGGAEATIFGGSAGSLAPPPPDQGTFVHQTQFNVDCGPQGTIYIVGYTPDATRNHITCTFSVKDLASPAPETPQGTISFALDSATYTCTLAGSGNTSACSPWTHVWQVGEGDAPGAHQLTASYQPTSNHWAAGPKVLNFTVRPYLQLSLSCGNPWRPDLGTNTTEIGHPLVCGLQATDVSRKGQPQPALTGAYAPILWSDNGSTGGVPYFSCVPATFDAVAKGCPPPKNTWTCQTDTTGFCRFEYRRIHDNSIRGAGADSIHVLAFPNDLQWPTLQAGATITPPSENANDPSAGHSVGMTVDCQSPSAPSAAFDSRGELVSTLVPGRGSSAWDLKLPTDHEILHTGTNAVTCNVVVFDGETPNPYFDAQLDTRPCPWAATDNRHCTAADAESYPPLGQVSVVDKSSGVSYGACVLQLAPFSYIEPGQTPYASACALTIPAGSLPTTASTYVNFVYGQEWPLAPASELGRPGHKAYTSADIPVNTGP